jgi:hypothetical protein
MTALFPLAVTVYPSSRLLAQRSEKLTAGILTAAAHGGANATVLMMC